MGYFKDLEIEIIEMFEEGATVPQIATKLMIDQDIVESLVNNYINQEYDYDESMDGDFDSAMTSAGFGTDEDYGYYGNE